MEPNSFNDLSKWHIIFSWCLLQTVKTSITQQMEAFPRIKQPKAELQRIAVIPDLKWTEIQQGPARITDFGPAQSPSALQVY